MNKLYKRVVTMGMISLTAILAWVYCMIEYRDELVYVAAASAVVLVAVYMLCLFLADVKAKKEEYTRGYISEAVNALVASKGEDATEADAAELERLVKAMYVQVRKSKSAQDEELKALTEIKEVLSESSSKTAKMVIKYNQQMNKDLLAAIDDLKTIIENKEFIAPAVTTVAPQAEAAPQYEAILKPNVESEPVAIQEEEIIPSADVIQFPATEPVKEEVKEESDGPLSQEDIEALFAAMSPSTPQEKEEEPAAPAPAPSSGGDTVLSPDEIAALFASMGN